MACLVSGLGISFEQPHKRTEITYFCLPKSIEAWWNLLEKRGIVKTLPHQNVRFQLQLRFVDYYICLGSGGPRSLFRVGRGGEGLHTKDLDEPVDREWKERQGEGVEQASRQMTSAKR